MALAQVLRPEDRRELAASHPQGGRGLVLESFIACSQQCVCLQCKDEVAALAGIYAPVALGMQACIWLLTGRAISRCKFSFVRLAKSQLQPWLELYPVLGNEVDARYVAAQRFIKFLGGRLEGAVSMHGKIAFLHFTFRRNIWEEL